MFYIIWSHILDIIRAGEQKQWLISLRKWVDYPIIDLRSLIVARDQEANSNNLGKNLFDLLHYNCMLRVLIWIASMRQF